MVSPHFHVLLMLNPAHYGSKAPKDLGHLGLTAMTQKKNEEFLQDGMICKPHNHQMFNLSIYFGVAILVHGLSQ